MKLGKMTRAVAKVEGISGMFVVGTKDGEETWVGGEKAEVGDFLVIGSGAPYLLKAHEFGKMYNEKKRKKRESKVVESDARQVTIEDVTQKSGGAE